MQFEEPAIIQQMISRPALCPRKKTISFPKHVSYKHHTDKGAEQSDQSLALIQLHTEALKSEIKRHRLRNLNNRNLPFYKFGG